MNSFVQQSPVVFARLRILAKLRHCDGIGKRVVERLVAPTDVQLDALTLDVGLNDRLSLLIRLRMGFQRLFPLGADAFALVDVKHIVIAQEGHLFRHDSPV